PHPDRLTLRTRVARSGILRVGMGCILIADDHEDSRELFGAILRAEGHEVHLAADGKEALAVYAEERPDLAVIDMFMPVMDGLEVLAEIRRAHPGAKLVAISAGWNVPARAATGEGTFDVLVDARRYADATLAKPVTRETLVD